MATLDPLQRAALEQAALWRARLNADAVDDTDRQAWQTWLDAHDQHRWAWQQVVQVQQRLGQLSGGLAGRTLDIAGQPAAIPRRGVLKGILVLAGTSGLGWAGYRELSSGPWTADYHTRVGKRQALTLADGTRLELNTDTALDVRYDNQQRLLVLRQGEVMITSAADKAGRPLRVQTVNGTVEALGTRFLVRRDSDASSTQLAVYQGQVGVMPRDGMGGAVVDAGDQVRFSHPKFVLGSPLEPDRDAWRRGLLIANDQMLGVFIAELRRYRPGWLKCANEVSSLRISGTFKLDDTEQILRAIGKTLPVRVKRRTKYWVSIEPLTT
ncbi:DUF4880 domain-containing protein [Pseudomonas sp. FBF18]|uniref:FecR domain-containing protein n=1 Tax=Pseudomonas TaxID=286 RepID=UPI0009EBAB16|nr:MULTISPECIES: FecR domain-containing protein [Pseudomonas]MCP8349245.1 DUF4880 domain-containing protein [Pseudomonas sp. FBF18]